MPERINASQVLVVVGGTALFVSMFLGWYDVSTLGGQESRTAWTAFELVDIVLAAIALAAIAAVLPLRRRDEPSLVPARLVPWLGVAALVLVAVSLVNDPPSVRGAGIETGAWIGLAAAGILALGGLLSLARVSLVVTVEPSEAPTSTLRENST